MNLFMKYITIIAAIIHIAYYLSYKICTKFLYKKYLEIFFVVFTNDDKKNINRLNQEKVHQKLELSLYISINC